MTPAPAAPDSGFDDGFGASWYHSSAHLPAPAPALAGTVDCDVCVVGGGIAGCSAALHLAQQGRRVVLLEQHRIGWGASGRSGAQAIFGVACGQATLETLVGAADARAIWDISVEGLALLRTLIAAHAIDCDYAPGQMHVAVKPRHVLELAHWHEELSRRYGYSSPRMLDAEEVRSLIGSPRYMAGMLDPDSGHLHPLKYVLGLCDAARRAGAMLFEGSRATRYTTRDGRVHVTTARGQVTCRQLLLAGNAWLGDVAPTLGRKIMNVGTFIIATEPLGAVRARELLRENVAVTDMNWVLDYFRRSADDRLLFGGRVSYSGRDLLDTARATRARMVKVFPQLAQVRVDYSWGGYVDITRNRAPHFGRLSPEVYFLQGFSGHGIALAGIAGKLVSEAITTSAARFDVFARIPHRDFPGGAALRRPALVLAMLYYRLRDLL